MISFFVGLVGAIIALVGWFGFHSLIALVIGTVLYIVETIMQLKELQPNALKFEITIFVVGCIVGLFLKIPFYIGGMLATNIYSAVISIIGLPAIIGQVISFLRFMKK